MEDNNQIYAGVVSDLHHFHVIPTTMTSNIMRSSILAFLASIEASIAIVRIASLIRPGPSRRFSLGC